MYKAGSKSTSMESINFPRKKSSKSSSEDLSITFKARPATVVHKVPFIPALSDKEPTIPEPFQLETELRHLNRLVFKEEHLQKMEMLQRIEQQREEKKREKEKEEIAMIRKLREIKATPVPKYKPMIIQPSSKRLTEPKSPTNHLKRGKMNKENAPNMYQIVENTS